MEKRGDEPKPKRIDFEDKSISTSFTKDNKTNRKEITVIKRLIDLNFLLNIVIAQGHREALEIDFEAHPFNNVIESIKAADEDNFESYLCVLPASVLHELYKRYSTRMLEKNVRSFLQFKGVNSGIKETIRKSPEKFIAYNNGLTITATGKEVIERNGKVYIKSLRDFQIVNGGQTTASIYFSGKEGLDISKVRVMAKINVAKNSTEEELDDLISNISTYSNAQNKVSKVDLRSRSSQLLKIKSLSESVVSPTGRKWFFERSKGEFNTKLRIAGSSGKCRIEKEYPK
ncbi:MAG: abortive phage infection protein, partial [Flavobacterium sp.]